MRLIGRMGVLRGVVVALVSTATLMLNAGLGGAQAVPPSMACDQRHPVMPGPLLPGALPPGVRPLQVDAGPAFGGFDLVRVGASGKTRCLGVAQRSWARFEAPAAVIDAETYDTASIPPGWQVAGGSLPNLAVVGGRRVRWGEQSDGSLQALWSEAGTTAVVVASGVGWPSLRAFIRGSAVTRPGGVI